MKFSLTLALAACSLGALAEDASAKISKLKEASAVAPQPKPIIPKYPAPGDVIAAMKKAVLYYRRNTSVVGGYAWAWPKDLSTNKGEDSSSPTLMMIQPPGTPAMGLAMLHAFQATGDPLFKQATREAAQSLLWSQSASGGWGSFYDFDPRVARKQHSRRDIDAGDTERGNRHADSTLDDEKTESALLFLVEMLHTPAFADDPELKHAVQFGFDGLLAAQAPNGGWGQHFDGPADKDAPVKHASIPKDWLRVWPGTDYTRHYTLNDNNILQTVRVLLRAYDLMHDERLRAAAKRAGDFLLLAQLPEPQAAWAQQYNRDMEPVWARKFEPPAVCSLESLGALKTLLLVWAATGDEKYRQPHAAALAWLERSKLSDGKWARYYELGTNTPLYCKRDTYEITHDDGDLPTHYGFKIDGLGEDIEKVKAEMALSREALVHKNALPTEPKKWVSRAKGVASKVVKAMQSQTSKGYWSVSDMIDAGEFVKHMEAMCWYVQAAREGGALFDALRQAESPSESVKGESSR